ncbi:MAG TPA: hypothetical protein VFI73_01095 [Candidatus Nitrosopolaris sp.]|nr:hypothetical protein [Candidatus Nitrosopolaris sp.]
MRAIFVMDEISGKGEGHHHRAMGQDITLEPFFGIPNFSENPDAIVWSVTISSLFQLSRILHVLITPRR